jgi:signal peptidase I
MEKIKRGINKFWYIVWKDDSLKGWIFSILFLFILIKFIFFPLLSLTTGTQLPLAIVESCSMYHQGDLFSNFDSWWQRHETKYTDFSITKEEFSDFNFKKGFNKGDILFIVGTKPEKLKIGDVIIFQSSKTTPIIHRIINIKEKDSGRTFSTIGDNNNGQISFETDISENQIIGRAILKPAPFIGWIKLIFYEPFRPENEKGFCNEN